jgi:ferric-dicitrate binding protein FerR (iron transport regulator)
MNCQLAANLMSALIDGEISSADQAALDSHLASCEGCRAALDALRSQDRALSAEVSPYRNRAEAVAAAAIRRVHQDQVRGLRFGWLSLVAAAAAGFAVALLVVEPWKSAPAGPGITRIVESTRPASNPALVPPPVGHLALATGTIEIQPEGEKDWRPMPTGGPVPAKSRVRTPAKVRCEFAMADGSEVRLNGDSELAFTSERTFDLARGQMWSSVAKASKPFIVAVADATITALGTQFDVLAMPQLTTLTVVEGSTHVKAPSAERLVKSGQQLRIKSGAPGDAETVHDLMLTTRWVNEILMLKGRDNQELANRTNDLLAQLGQTKLENLYEQEIRSLGDHCVMPLMRYLQSDRSKGGNEQYRRHEAARILADLAQPWSIPDLVGLLEDADGEVRYQAANALRRLTGLSMRVGTEQWRTPPTERTRLAVTDWKKWLTDNADRYPSAPGRKAVIEEKAIK